MTATPSARFQKFVAMIKDAVFLAALIVSLSTAVGGFVITLAWPRFINQLRADLDVATREDLRNFQEQLNVLTGENKIIRIPEGHSYVSEPVTQGKPIDLTLVMSRTNRGLSCIFVSGTPLFKDGRDIAFAGPQITPIKQISTQIERLQLKLQVPAEILPGRVGVQLSLRYACPFGQGGLMVETNDETQVIFFQMDPAPTLRK